jgi:hypothetical protein
LDVPSVGEFFTILVGQLVGAGLPMEYLWPLYSVRITIEMACAS